MKKLILALAICGLASTAMAAPKKPYVVKLTGKTEISESGDSLSFQTSKGWKDVYLYGLDEKSHDALSQAIRKKSCLQITEGKNTNEWHMGAVLRPAKCR